MNTSTTRTTLQAALLGTLLLFTSLTGHAEGTLFRVPTRPDVKTTLFWETAANAKATVLLFPGGGGGFGKVVDGQATGGNFLVRSAPHFLARGFNVAIFGRPSDTEELGWADRTAAPHLADARAVLDFVKQKSTAPVWIVGTSRGTVSATAMAIHVQDLAIAGLVLTASAVKPGTPGNVPGQNLSAIALPVLVLHHSKDACIHCAPSEVPAILQGLANAPVKKLIFVDGGAHPSGDVCAAMHFHGFIGMETEAVDLIAGWIGQPTR